MYSFTRYFTNKDNFYRQLSLGVGLISAYALFTALNQKNIFILPPLDKTVVRFETTISNTNTELKYTPKNSIPLDKKDPHTPAVQAPSKNPVPTLKPTSETKTTKKAMEYKAVQLPEQIKTPQKDGEKTGADLPDNSEHIEQDVPNEVVNTGGVFGSGTPPVNDNSKGPMLEIPRVLDTTEVDDVSQMRDKVDKAAGMSDKPPLPSEDAVDQSVYTDAPGGEVVILKLYINDRGLVIDSKIMIPSKYPLNDLSVALSSRGAQFKNMVPPLLPGEVRELEVRVPYVIDKASATKNNLP